MEDGWVDLACGPVISLVIQYTSRNHHPDSEVPHTLHVNLSAPCVLLRVFGFLATDLLGLKVCSVPQCLSCVCSTTVPHRRTTLESIWSSPRTTQPFLQTLPPPNLPPNHP